MRLFDIYWRLIGLPLSRCKGAVTDAIPFSLVEASIWFGGAMTLLWLASWFSPFKARLRRGRRWFLILGPLFLAVLGMGQGAFPLSLAPSSWRTSIPRRLGSDSLGLPQFQAWVHEREANLRKNFNWDAYQSLTEADVQSACDTSLDTVLRDLGLPPGRHVRTIKAMGPLTTDMGLIYGGPAFHDPFFGELAMVHDADEPSPHYWRLIAACHETAHAKGFTREIDAEVLTQLALERISHPRYQALADIHFLRKTGMKISWPDSLVAESKRVRARWLEVEKHQPVISFFRKWIDRWHLENSGGKYGDRKPHQAWNPHQPFFATIHRLQTRVAPPDRLP